jgi:hypothetical protein
MPSAVFSDGRVTRCAVKYGNEYQEMKFTGRLMIEDIQEK